MSETKATKGTAEAAPVIDVPRCLAVLAGRGKEAGLTLTQEQLDQFGIYYEKLIETNAHLNLTALTSPDDVAVKHFIDSLLAYDPQLMKPGATLIDVGTGAGFPGLPLKFYVPELKVTLLDSLEKRLRFLDDVLAATHVKGIRLVHARAEDGGRDPKHRGQYDVAVSRAVAKLSVLAEYCLPFVKRGGYFVALKGSKYEAEIAEAQHALAVLGGKLAAARPVHLPGLDDGRAVVVIRKVKDTPAAYPRKAGLPSKKPL
ncbi:MAG: 16S rRNA (guanine(527)-N(7))-methyltransferase RsmG [Succiniclasticum sp.]|jgi:16S rRNA (guanine527-N7)-methyltransferase|nr:16S rRNA (guanine(527)-N(7))-methyltransferase RsmG [Succiniclasticum sp.]MEE3479931.1 16S rRNA (guanine(527)-N(7))-methyltransferase RsmG [Succiniclasticum sp.]